jgi:hypothetical protein
LARAPQVKGTLSQQKQGFKRGRKVTTSPGGDAGVAGGKKARRIIVVPQLLDEEEAELISPTFSHENLKLELPGAWEPLDSS